MRPLRRAEEDLTLRRGEPQTTIWGYRLWVLVLALLLGSAAAGGVAYYSSDQAAPTYEATALLQVVSGRQVGGEFVGQQELLQLTNVTAELARTRPVADAAAATLDDSTSVVRRSVDVSTREQVQIMEIRASSGRPERAADIANAYADAVVGYLEERNRDDRTAAIDQIQERVDEIKRELAQVDEGDPAAVALDAELAALQARGADLRSRLGDTGRIIQPARAPGSPASPKPLRDAVLVGIAALIVIAGLLYARSRLTDRYGSVDELVEDLRLPVIGEVPRGKDEALTMESVRALRTNVAFALEQTAHPVLLTTSAGPGAGKTHLSILLARAFVDDGQRLALVDGDLRRPAMHDRLPIARQPGIGDLVASDLTGPPELTTQHVPRGRDAAARGGDLEVVSAGRQVADPAEALGSERMVHALAALRNAYDLVIVDSPPVLAVVDPVVLSRQADGVLLIVDLGRERRADVRRAAQTLRAVDARLLGVVVNGSAASARYGYYGPRPEGRRAAQRARSR